MTTKGIDLLISFEGLRLNAYLDSSGKPTIGYGCTYYENGDPVKLGDSISAEEAMRLFKTLVDNTYEKGVRDNLRVELQPNQIDALTSLCYNIGVTALKNSTVLRLINAEAPKSDIQKAWRMWRMAGGEVLQGLVNRRERELEYYYSHEPVASTVTVTTEPVVQEAPNNTVAATTNAKNKDPMYTDKLWFTTSTRFLAGLVGVLALLLGEDGVATGPEVYQALIALSGLFIGLKTLHTKESIEAFKK